jgi:hypothetical protein
MANPTAHCSNHSKTRTPRLRDAKRPNRSPPMNLSSCFDFARHSQGNLPRNRAMA